MGYGCGVGNNGLTLRFQVRAFKKLGLEGEDGRDLEEISGSLNL